MKKIIILGLTLLILSSGITGFAERSPACSNEAIVIARVVQYTIEGEDDILYSLGLRVINSISVKGLPDFTRDKAGKTIVAYSRQPLSPQLFGKQIEVRVRYRGDETRGRFWIIEVKEDVAASDKR